MVPALANSPNAANFLQFRHKSIMMLARFRRRSSSIPTSLQQFGAESATMAETITLFNSA
jgi:hypothetical protein